MVWFERAGRAAKEVIGLVTDRRGGQRTALSFFSNLTAASEANKGERMSRFDYVKYDEMAIEFQEKVKQHVTLLENMIGQMESPRAKAIAITKLEEVYMWMGKAIRDDQIARNGSAPLQEERKNG